MAFDFLRDPKFLRRILDTFKSLGFVGGVVLLLFGLALFVHELEWWQLLPEESSIRRLLAAHAESKGMLVSQLIIIVGIAALLNQSGLRTFWLLRNINKAVRRRLLEMSTAHDARIIVISRRLGADVKAIDLNFAEFLRWSGKNKHFTPKSLENIENAWRAFRSHLFNKEEAS